MGKLRDVAQAIKLAADGVRSQRPRARRTLAFAGGDGEGACCLEKNTNSSPKSEDKLLTELMKVVSTMQAMNRFIDILLALLWMRRDIQRCESAAAAGGYVLPPRPAGTTVILQLPALVETQQAWAVCRPGIKWGLEKGCRC